MTRTRDKTPDWLLERIALGELPADELAEKKRRLLEEPEGAARLAALEASNRAILADHPPETEVAQIGAKAAAKAAGVPAPRRTWRWGALALAPAVAVALVLVVRSGSEDYTGIKGDPRLEVHRRTAEGSEKLGVGASLRPGDLLQLSYVAAGRTHGVILSVDGRGGVTLHWPVRPEDGTTLTQGGDVALDHAIELDDAPGFERFFFVTNDAPIDVQGVLAAARALAADAKKVREAPLSLPKGVGQVSLFLQKDAP